MTATAIRITTRDKIVSYFVANDNRPATVAEIVEDTDTAIERVRKVLAGGANFHRVGKAKGNGNAQRWQLATESDLVPPEPPAEEVLWGNLRRWLCDLLTNDPGLVAPVLAKWLGLSLRRIEFALDHPWFEPAGRGWRVTTRGRAAAEDEMRDIAE